MCENNPSINSIEEVDKKGLKLSELNLKRVAYELSEAAFLSNKIEDGSIQLKGLIYNREDGSFKTSDVLF
jgi:hypothetical protein